jgi:hypothetical protein
MAPCGPFSGEPEIHSFAAFWRERKENSNIAWTKVWRCGVGNQPTKLCLSDTEIVADSEQGDKAILLPRNQCRLLFFSGLQHT